MVEYEWARTADDVLWRRSKLGISASAGERTAVEAFIASLGQPPKITPAGQASS
jgi:glycerol-3-phosphate dehydrogenase